MSQEHWFYDDERQEVIDCTIPDGRTAAPSYPVCRLMNHQGMRRSEVDAAGRRIASLPALERRLDEIHAKAVRMQSAIVEYYRWKVGDDSITESEIIDEVMSHAPLPQPNAHPSPAQSLLDRPVVLFVEPESIYKRMGLDCYDKARDARTYTGNAPVIAHPPCQLWGALAAVNYARWGGDHNRPGNDGGLFRFALETVRRCGGVLEHPAKTRAWARYGLTEPTAKGWQPCHGGGWVCEVWQSAYGHRANKATWLYLVGEPLPLRWERPTGSHQVGFHDRRGKARNKPTLSKREANATPEAFALELVHLARGCSKPNAHADRPASAGPV